MNPHRYTHTLSRRSILRGLGASLALPFLPSLAWAQAKGSENQKAPRRFAVLLFGNGVNEQYWWQKADENGRIQELSRSLQPLAGIEDQLLFLNNLHLFDDTTGVHTPYFTNFLTGIEVPAGSIPHLAESVDQLMARTVGKATPLPALNVGTESTSLGGGGSKPSVYNGTISWSSSTTPVIPEISPQIAFDRLFDTSSLMRDRSVLDAVSEHAKQVRGKLDAFDRTRLDDYLQSIRDLEQRIEKATSPRPEDAWQPSLAKPDMQRPTERVPDDLDTHMKLMLDLLVLALRMDKTRVATFLFQKDLSGQRFQFLPGVDNTGMHGISHHRQRPEYLEMYRKINEFHVRKLRYVLDKMAAVDEGHDTTLLDNTLLLFGSTMMDGDKHDANKLPLILCGGRSAGVKPGRIVEYEKLEDRRLCNLYLDLLQRMGYDETKQFGNSHYALPGIG